jgi:hypothetical protein
MKNTSWRNAHHYSVLFIKAQTSTDANKVITATETTY